MKRIIHLFAATLLVVSVLTSTAWAATGDLLWKIPTNGGYIASSPALGIDGTIYYGSSNGDVNAVSPSGVVQWRYHTGGAVDDSPAVGDDGTIYVGSFDTYLYALTPDGSLCWRFQTGGLIRSTPALAADGAIIVGSYDGYLYAINPDGSIRWKFKTDAKIATSPLISIDGKVCFGDTAGKVYLLSPDGSLLWDFLTGGEIHWSSPASGIDGTFYICSWDGYLYALFPDGTLRWKFRTGAKIGSSPAIGADGTIYVESCDTFLYALNSDGSLQWKYDVQNRNLGCHPTVGSDGTVYVGSDDGYFYAVNADGSLKWRYKTGDSLWTTGAPIDNTGVVYFVSSDGCMYAVDTGTDAGIANTPWPKFHRDLANSGRMGKMVSLSSTRVVIRDVGIDESASGTVVLRNFDSEPVTVQHIGVDNDRFEVTPGSGVVPPSDSLLVTITFTPSKSGEQRALVTITLDDRELTVAVIGNPPSEPVRVPVRLVTRDGDTGELLPCRIYLTDSHGRYVLPEETGSRDSKMFFVSSGDIQFFLFSGRYSISIARGNEYIPIHDEVIDIPGNDSETFTIELTLSRWVHMKELGWYSCDNQVNNYDRREPETLYVYQLAEDMNILHLICLGSYNSVFNYEYFRKGVFPFSQPYYPMVIGEEWRSRTWQNHMVIMNHSQPVSVWGSGYYDGASPYPYSYPPAMDICDEAHQYGGIVTATHPFWYDPFTQMENEAVNRNLAFETPADVALGKVDGMQIYMYWQYDEWNRYVWYRLLNCGFRIAPFAGSDALLSNTASVNGVMGALSGTVRSYAYVPDQTERLDYDAWITASKEGRSFVSSGAVLLFTVNGELPGSVIDVSGNSATVTVSADARWTGGLERIIFIVNGETVVERAIGGKSAVVTENITLTGSSWISCRVEGKKSDEYEGDAHSGPVYVTLDGKPQRSREDALYFAGWIDRHIALLDSANHFEFEWQKELTFNRYREAQDVYYRLADEAWTEVDSPKPGQFALFPNYPNPFNASTIIRYSLPSNCHVTLDVFDILGRKITTLDDGMKSAGTYKISWDGTDSSGAVVGTGVYLSRLQAGGFAGYGKMVVVK